MHQLQHPKPIMAGRHPPCRCQAQIGGRHGSDGTTSASVLLGFYGACLTIVPCCVPVSQPFPTRYAGGDRAVPGHLGHLSEQKGVPALVPGLGNGSQLGKMETSLQRHCTHAHRSPSGL